MVACGLLKRVSVEWLDRDSNVLARTRSYSARRVNNLLHKLIIQDRLTSFDEHTCASYDYQTSALCEMFKAGAYSPDKNYLGKCAHRIEIGAATDLSGA